MILKLLTYKLTAFLKTKLVLLGLILFSSFTLSAHGSLTALIKQVSVEIAKEPNNKNLYFERGLLHQLHDDYRKAIKDYLKSEKLGNTDNTLHFHKAEAYYLNNNFKQALKSSTTALINNSKDVKFHKIHAQILIKLNRFNEAKKSFDYVLETRIDLRPEDFIEYSELLLAIDNNYNNAIDAIDLGIQKLGAHTQTLHLVKLDYLKASNQQEKIIDKYNYFITINNRKELWYFEKAKYLHDINNFEASNIALQQSKLSIQLLAEKLQNTKVIKDLTYKINTLEKLINTP